MCNQCSSVLWVKLFRIVCHLHFFLKKKDQLDGLLRYYLHWFLTREFRGSRVLPRRDWKTVYRIFWVLSPVYCFICSKKEPSDVIQNVTVVFCLCLSVSVCLCFSNSVSESLSLSPLSVSVSFSCYAPSPALLHLLYVQDRASLYSSSSCLSLSSARVADVWHHVELICLSFPKGQLWISLRDAQCAEQTTYRPWTQVFGTLRDYQTRKLLSGQRGGQALLMWSGKWVSSCWPSYYLRKHRLCLGTCSDIG